MLRDLFSFFLTLERLILIFISKLLNLCTEIFHIAVTLSAISSLMIVMRPSNDKYGSWYFTLSSRVENVLDCKINESQS